MTELDNKESAENLLLQSIVDKKTPGTEQMAISKKVAKFELMKWTSLLLLLFHNSCSPIVFRFATTGAGISERFRTDTAVLCTELIKLFLSVALLFREEGMSMPQTRKTLCQTLEYPQIRDTAKLAIPAILYFIQNMLVQHAASNLPAALFQVTSQGKTLIVAVLAIGVLGKIITRAQWLSICLMAIGLVTVQMANTSESSQKSMKNSAEQSVKTGLILILLGSFCSAFASVYFEKMMKTPTGMRAPSIWLRNIQLAMCSAIIGGVAVTLFDSEKAVFHGFNGHVWFMIVNNAVGGLFVAMAINYAGNVAKGFTYAVATVLTCLLSVPLLGFSVDAYFFCGMLLVCWSCLLYSGSVRIPVFTEWWGREPVLCGQVRKTSAGELITLAQGKVGQSSAIELKTQSALAVTV